MTSKRGSQNINSVLALEQHCKAVFEVPSSQNKQGTQVCHTHNCAQIRHKFVKRMVPRTKILDYSHYLKGSSSFLLIQLFERGSHCVVQMGLEPIAILPPSVSLELGPKAHSTMPSSSHNKKPAKTTSLTA